MNECPLLGRRAINGCQYELYDQGLDPSQKRWICCILNLCSSAAMCYESASRRIWFALDIIDSIVFKYIIY